MLKLKAIGLNALKLLPGIVLCVGVAIVAMFTAKLIPGEVVGASVFALFIGIVLNVFLSRFQLFKSGLNFTSKKLLKLAIILMGVTLSFKQIVQVGSISLIVMCFTLLAAFGFGYLFGRLFKMNWKLSNLISAGTGICGGSAIAAISPVIKAKDSDVAYAIAATFIFDVAMVIIMPLVAKGMGMSDLGFGLWAGTAVNDTSSVVAAGYAFSEAAGNFSIIVKLTRTLSIVPIVIIFSVINAKIEKREQAVLATANAVPPTDALQTSKKSSKLHHIIKIFPYFILLFLGVVAIKSTGILSNGIVSGTASGSKFLMVMALGAIGLKTNFKDLFKSGFKPMLHGFIISLLVVLVSLAVQFVLGQI